MIWNYLLRPVLGPFSGTVEGRVAIKKANQRFAHINRFIAELNETLSEYIPPGLVSSTGVSLTAWSREGDHITSSLRLRSLRKQEMIIPLRIKVGTDQVEIGEASLLLSDSERLLNVITRIVSDFFST
jgi:riboflavin synthase alpha subunit